MGSIHHLTRYIPNLAQTAAALRPLLKNTLKNKPINWKPEHNTSFENIKKLVSEITQNKHFDQRLETRIITDASTSGLGASLEQYLPEGWVAIAYASRFLNSLEEMYSVNELELLGVVWAIEHHKYYLYGKHFTVITDHQALISVLNASERSKTSQSRLTRWIDRIFPFHFDIKHLAGNKMGLIDYMSRDPIGLEIPPSEYDEEFVVASINTFINNFILNELANQNLAPCQLIKKRAEHKRTTINTSKRELKKHSFKNSASGQLQTQKPNQFCSNHSANQTALTRNITSKQNSLVGKFNKLRQTHSQTTEYEPKTGS